MCLWGGVLYSEAKRSAAKRREEKQSKANRIVSKRRVVKRSEV